jgi:DNA-binding response OmpR family regulator
MTARNTKTDVVRAMDAGANDYVVKPVNLPILREKIEALLNAKGTTPSHEKVVMSVPAVYSIAMHVFEVSENGLLLESEESLPLDYKFQIKSDIFDQIKIQSPVLRVVGCESRLGEPDRVTIRTHFTNLSEKDKATLSAWIRNKKAA